VGSGKWEVGSEMSKGERMRTHTERTESDHLSAQNSPAKMEKEKDTLCVANLERFARFITQRVMNFSPRLKRMQKTRELEFGTRCVPNLENTLSIKIYTDERISKLDQAELELEAEIEQGMRELEGLLK
jgi:hypothetical protein